MLKLVELLDIFNSGETLTMDEEALETCNYYSQEAQKFDKILAFELYWEVNCWRTRPTKKEYKP